MVIVVKILLLLTLTLGCSGKTFDSVVEQQPAGSTNNEEAMPKVVAEGMLPIKIEPSELFVLNPSQCYKKHRDDQPCLQQHRAQNHRYGDRETT